MQALFFSRLCGAETWVTALFLLAFLAGLRGVVDGKGPQSSSYDDIGWDGGRSDRRLGGCDAPRGVRG